MLEDKGTWNHCERDQGPNCESRSLTDVANSAGAAAARTALAHASRIGIISKIRFMGDTIVATPFLQQLHEQFPNASLTLFGGTTVVTALANCPFIDKFVNCDTNGTGRLSQDRFLFQQLRAGGFQVAFELNRSLRCALLAAVAKIPIRIGYTNEFRKPLLTVPIPYRFDRNEVDCHLDMLRALGLPAHVALPDLWITQAERERARARLVEAGWSPDSGRNLLAVQPGANDPGIREWGATRYAKVADALAQRIPAQVVIMGGAAECGVGAEMQGAMRTTSINLTGKLSLREALAVVGECGLWIGNDTGLLHAAVSLRVPSVGLFGPNKVVRWGYDTPRHRSLVVFPDQPALDDATLRRCLDAITEEQVIDAGEGALKADTPDSTRIDTLSPEPIAFAKSPYFAANATQSRVVAARRR